MFKGLLLALGMAVSLHATAATDINTFMIQASEAILAEPLAGPNWKVGDSTNYKLNVGGFINGTMAMKITALTASEMTMSQDMDLGFAGKQSCEAIIDTKTGKTKKLTCGGQDQTPSGDEEMEIVDMKEDKVTVPAGSYECVYIKVLMKKDNSEIEQWANPKLIPITGMLKMIAPSQIGKMTVELTSFKKM